MASSNSNCITPRKNLANTTTGSNTITLRVMLALEDLKKSKLTSLEAIGVDSREVANQRNAYLMDLEVTGIIALDKQMIGVVISLDLVSKSMTIS